MCANSCPENFIQQQDDKTMLETVEPGLYEIKMAFFSQFRPPVDFRVNEETVLIAVSNPQHVVHHGTNGKVAGRVSY